MISDLLLHVGVYHGNAILDINCSQQEEILNCNSEIQN